jgi:hypothetical protein
MKKKSDLVMKYWENGKHILISNKNFDMFLRNEWLNPMINWLNLHRYDMAGGEYCGGLEDKLNELDYSTVRGNLMIRNYRDLIFLSPEETKELKQWLNKHRELLGIREVLLE